MTEIKAVILSPYEVQLRKLQLEFKQKSESDEASAIAVGTTIGQNTSDISSIQNTLENHSSAISELDTSLNELNLQYSDVETTLSSHYLQLTALTSSVTDLNTQLTSLSSTVSTQESTLTELNTQLISIASDTENLKEWIDPLVSDLSSLSTLSVAVESDVETIKSDVSTLQTETATNTNDISSLSSQVQTNTSDISSLKTFENGINTTIDNRVKTDLTTTYSNSDYESMTGLKTWVESKGGSGLTMDEIEDNLSYEGENVKNFVILSNTSTNFDTRTNKLDLNDYDTDFPATFVRKQLISFYKNNNNKICGFCLFEISRITGGKEIADNAGNTMILYTASSDSNLSGQITLKIYNDLNNEIQSSMSFSYNTGSWNFMNVFFNENYSDTIIKAFFGDNVSVNDIHCTNVNDYIRTSDDTRFDTTNPHPTYNLQYSDSFLKDQTKSYLTTIFTNDDFESMTNLKAWIQSLINNQN